MTRLAKLIWTSVGWCVWRLPFVHSLLVRSYVSFRTVLFSLSFIIHAFIRKLGEGRRDMNEYLDLAYFLFVRVYASRAKALKWDAVRKSERE